MRKLTVPLFSLLAVIFLCYTAAFAGIHGAKPAANDKAVTSSVSASARHMQFNPSSLSSVQLDFLPNPLGILGSAQQPVAYDPASSCVAVDYRHNPGTGSGNIFYMYSTDNGSTWSARQGPLNGTYALTGRYPSIGLSNPTGGSDPTSATAVEYAFPELVGGAFGGMIYGVDAAVGAGALTTVFDTSYVWSSDAFVAPSNDNNQTVLMFATETSDASIPVSKSTDNGQTWSKPAIPSGLNEADICDTTNAATTEWGVWNLHGADYMDGTYFMGLQVLGPKGFKGDTLEIDYVLLKSTDQGTTWTRADICRPSQISALNSMTNFTYNGANGVLNAEEYDFAIDASGKAHFFGVFADTTHGTQGVYELTNASGSWVANKVASLNMILNYDGYPQRCNEIEAARSSDGTEIAVKWIDVATASDSVSDIFAAGEKNGTWVAAKNLTNTSQTAGPYYCFSHMANRLGPNGQLFIVWGSDTTGAPPTDAQTNNPYWIWFLQGANVTGIHGAVDNVPAAYALHQNYPNPFNPTTRIEYSVPQNGFASLKVYNVLGQEVSTLFSGIQKAGDHYATFDASHFASGVYFYRLQAGNFNTTKKMVLMK